MKFPAFSLNRLRQLLIKTAAVSAIIWLVVILIAILSVTGEIELTEPVATPFFEDCQGRYISEGDTSSSEPGFWKPSGKLPHKISAAFIAIEDHRFRNHPGVDPIALLRAVLNNISGKRREGGSTLQMQIARMQNPGKRSLWKKLCEIVTAMGLTMKFDSDTLLRHYLTIVPQGNRIHGVSYSSRRYFRKPLQDLGWCEASILAAIVKAPGRMNLFRTSGFKAAVRRAETVLLRLLQTGKLSNPRYQQELKNLHKIRKPVKETRPYNTYHLIEKLGKILKSSGYTDINRPFRSSINMDIQNKLSDIATSAMNRYRRDGTGNIAIVAVSSESGEVKGYIGSEYYFDDLYAGSINYAATPRASGSTLKPFIYALGLLDSHYLPSSVLGDMPFFITHEDGQYLVKNYDSLFMGPMVYRKALANSRNTPAVKLVRSLGVQRVHSFCKESGLERSSNPASHYGLGIAIGGLYVTLEDLVQSYGIFSAMGRKYHLKWFKEKIEEPECSEQLISSEICKQINLFLSDSSARLPSFKRMGNLEYPFQVAVKTGTSQGFRDAWCIAWSKKYIVGVWMGHPSGFRMKRVSGLVAAGVAKQVMLTLHPGTEDYGSFTPPTSYKACEICSRSGKLKTDYCSDTIIEFFKPGTEPIDKCSIHKAKIVKENGIIKKLPYSDYPAEYSAWAHKHGLSLKNSVPALKKNPQLIITNPVNNSGFVIDPSTPSVYQTIGLEATVWPEIEKIIWIVDGKEQAPVAFPYSSRWQLKPGIHTFQARFPNASIKSNVVRITVKK